MALNNWLVGSDPDNDNADEASLQSLSYSIVQGSVGYVYITHSSTHNPGYGHTYSRTPLHTVPRPRGI